MSTVQTATPSLGFDVDQPLSSAECTLFTEAGYKFCIRYIPRSAANLPGNLTALETQVILTSGLALMVVQHVALSGWLPNSSLGSRYGDYAVAYCKSIGLPLGMNVWLDLEEVAQSSTAQDVINYCDAWYGEVAAASYVPGIYVGWDIVLTPKQLHENIPFEHYWNAYNGPGVAVRGCQILQQDEDTLEGVTFDPNTIQADNEGNLPIWLIY